MYCRTKIFIQLVTIEKNNQPTRKFVTQENNFIKNNWNLITNLASNRLVIINLLEKQITVEISHEKLITAWSRYYQWVQKHQDFLRWRSQLSHNINQWKNHKKTKGSLLKDNPLITANIWYKQRQDDLAKEEKEFIKKSLKVRYNQRIRLSLIITIVIGSVLLTGIYAWIQSKERQLEQLIRYASSQVITPDNVNIIIDVLPKYLESAKKQKKINNIEQAIDDYRQVLLISNKTYEKMKENSQKFNNSVTIQEKLTKISQKAESSLGEMIAIYRLPKLEKQLNNKQFGERELTGFLNPDTGTTEYDYLQTVYTGALKTTRDIIMTDLGAKIDQNNNKIIDEEEENGIPCTTLIQIERLWREATDNQCGWYGIDNIFESNCQLLQGKTLTDILYPTSDFSLLAKRLEYCKIIPDS